MPVTTSKTKKAVYRVPKIDFATASYQSFDMNGRMDKIILGIPTHTGFSNNKKKIFGIPPDYKDAKINVGKNNTIQIKIN